MNTPDVAPTTAHTATHTHIRDPRHRTVARAVWAAIVLLSWALYIMGKPVHFDELREISSDVRFGSEQLSALEAQALADLGLSIDVYAVYQFSHGIVINLVFSLVGVVIFWRRADDWMALFVSLALITFAIGSGTAVQGLLADQPNLRLPIKFIQTIGLSSFIALLCLFPDGRPVPRWTRILIAGWTIYVALVFYSIENPWRSPLVYLTGLLIIAVGVLAQIYRYVRVSGPVQRQQTKWIVLGLAAMFVGFLLSFLRSLLLPSLEQSGLAVLALRLVGDLFRLAPYVLMGVAFGFAILRYRLYDIDLIINRSLVYAIVTLLLAMVFLAGVFVIQAVLGHEQSGIAFAVSLLGAGALFNPARKRVQHVIDRRLYGFRFDLDELNKAQQLPAVKNPGALTGRTLGAYQVLGVLGKGGMGEVYQGEGNGHTVAIKILPHELASLEEFRKRFEREAQTLTTFSHPNIVKLYDYGESGGVHYMVMEYVDGQELNDIIKERGRIPLDDVRPFLADFAAALNYAHEKGFVHRDIKPSNIMVRRKDGQEALEAVLMDFGIAKVQDARTALTGTGAIGSIDYMAPEQIMAARDVDHRADIYALGVVTFEMLTGERPFKGSAGQVVFAHLQQPPPDPLDLNHILPARVARAIMKAMAKQPEDRFQSVGEFAAALG